MFSKILDLLKRLLGILNIQQKVLALVVLWGSFLSAVLELLGVSIIVPLVTVMLTPDKLLENKYIAIAAEQLGIDDSRNLVQFILLLVIFIYILKNLYFIFFAWVKEKYANKIQREVSVRMVTSYMERGYQFFVNKNMNEIFYSVTSDVVCLYKIIANLIQIFTQLLITFFICVYMCIIDWQIALALVGTILLCLGIILVFFRRRMLQAGEKVREFAIKEEQTLRQAFYGIKEVMIMHKQKYFTETFSFNSAKRQRAQLVQNVGAEIPAYVIEGACVSGLLLVLGTRMTDTSSSVAFVSVLASFAVAAFRVLPSIGKISSSLNTIMSAICGFDSVWENLKDQDVHNKKTVDIDILSDMDYKSVVELKNLTFAYNNEQKVIINQLNLTINKGQAVAFIGESGAGKSTLIDLILGLLYPVQGEILVDGIDIKKVPKLWSQLVGYVPQNIYLADTTIVQNIAFGVDEKEIDYQKIEQVLERVKMLDYINALPDGLNTEIGERGIRLSGGQRQRLAIARALYRSPQILVLDEATSALDNDTEKVVMEAIDSLHGEITIIIVAHRLSTIKNCDYIYELKEGKIDRRIYEELDS